MLRVNLFLLLITVGCALGVVAGNDKVRRLLVAYESAQAHMRDLEIEQGQLQLEQSTWANHARIEQVALKQLTMRAPKPEEVIVLEAAP